MSEINGQSDSPGARDLTGNKRTNLSTEIYTIIRQRILNWEYPPNYRLREEALCEEFGVSRVPVREALHMLDEQRLVKKVPYQGCRVQQPDLQEIYELYDVRLALELFVVEQLAREGLDEELWETLRTTWERLSQVEEVTRADVEHFARIDEDFHESLARATGNTTLAAMLRDLNARLSFVRLMDIQDAERLRHTCRQHVAILDAIQAGAVAAVQDAARANVLFGRHNVEIAIKDALSKAYRYSE